MKDWEIKKKGSQIELRKAFNGANLLIIISKDGWNYGKIESRNSSNSWQNTKGFDIRISANGPVWLTKSDWDEIKNLVDSEYEKISS